MNQTRGGSNERGAGLTEEDTSSKKKIKENGVILFDFYRFQ